MSTGIIVILGLAVPMIAIHLRGHGSQRGGHGGGCGGNRGHERG